MSQSFTIEYPDRLPDSLNMSRREFERDALMALAAKLYELGRLSSDEAAGMAGLDRVRFLLARSLHPEMRRQFHRPRSRGDTTEPRIFPDKSYVLLRTEEWEQLRVLENKTQLLPPQHTQPFGFAKRHPHAVQRQFSAARREQASEDAQQRRLPRTRRPQQHTRFPGADFQGHTRQHHLRQFASAIRHADLAAGERRTHGSPHPSSQQRELARTLPADESRHCPSDARGLHRRSCPATLCAL